MERDTHDQISQRAKNMDELTELVKFNDEDEDEEESENGSNIYSKKKI